MLKLQDKELKGEIWLKLLAYVEHLEGQGQYWFLKSEALKALGTHKAALEGAIRRLMQKKRVALIRAGFLVIIPITYKSKGIIPADWFIQPLMDFMRIPYYIALLTASNFYGAAHQKPQVFQVMIGKKLRSITKHRLRIVFYEKADLDVALAQPIQVNTGYAKIATPELTAIELVQYHRACGYLSNVATVLSELKERIDAEKFLQLADPRRYEWAVLQRLGYLMSLEAVGGSQLVEPLKCLIRSEKPRFAPLQAGQLCQKNLKNAEWRLWINEEVEVDI